jgi:uncharacterized membrane protein YfcA
MIFVETEIIAGFLIAILSGMGVGSAGLFVVWLTGVEKLPQLEAQGLNLYFFLFSSSASLIIHLRKRKILWGAVILMTLAGAAGALLGTYLAALAAPVFLGKLFGIMLLASGSASAARTLLEFRRCGKKGEKKKEKEEK